MKENLTTTNNMATTLILALMLVAVVGLFAIYATTSERYVGDLERRLRDTEEDLRDMTVEKNAINAELEYVKKLVKEGEK